MDINTIKLIRDGYNGKETENDKSQTKQADDKKGKKGCLKLADYMAF